MNQEMTCCENKDTALREQGDARVETRNATQPVWNARQHEKGVDLEVLLPGVRREDLDLEVVGRQLRLKANRNTPEDRGRLVLGTPVPDAYELKLNLADKLDGDSLTAHLADGVLTIGVPLVESAQPRKIEVN